MDNIIQKLRDGLAGRSGRQQFWVRFLIIVMANVVGAFILGIFGGPSVIVSFITLPLWLYIAARRFHDLGLTGWLGLIPFGGGFVIGPISAVLPIDPAIKTGLVTWFAPAITLPIILWLGCVRGQPEANRFGPPPGQESPAEVF